MKKLPSLTLIFILISLSAYSQIGSLPETATLPAELDRVLRDYEQYWQSKNAVGLASLFDKEGFILRPGHTPVKGRKAIAKAYEGAGGPLYLCAYHYAVDGNIGYIIGGYGASPDRISGKFTLTLIRSETGKWLIKSDMDNGNYR